MEWWLDCLDLLPNIYSVASLLSGFPVSGAVAEALSILKHLQKQRFSEKTTLANERVIKPV
jgi:hypothetical protein